MESSGKFTDRESDIQMIEAHGYTPAEAGDIVGIAYETARKVISNIKPKVGYNISVERVAEYWCQRFGTTLEEQRKIMFQELSKAGKLAKKHSADGIKIAIALLLSMAVIKATNINDRRRVNLRRPRIEYRIRIQSTRYFG